MKWNKQSIIQAFSNMEVEGWNTSKSLKWGFFFMDVEKDKLLAVFNELKDHQYILVYLDFRDDLELWVLYVTKEEILTLDKLHRRNLSFEELANYYEVECYDGWDVEKK